MLTAVAIILILFVIWYFKLDVIAWIQRAFKRENYGPCNYCDDYRVPRNGTLVLNPYVWPYSGTQNVDDLYILSRDNGTDFNFECGPLTQLNAPDHVILTN